MVTPLSLRRDVRLLTDEAAGELQALWRDAETPELVEAALRDVLPGLVAFYGAGAATVAADWYDDLRDERGVRGRFTAIPADIAETGTQALVGWALSEATDLSTFKVLIEGGMQRRIANYPRQTVMDSSIADPQADGWQRVSTGNCNGGFCDMLAASGVVYSEAAADFASHDHCQCVAVAAFSGEERLVKPYKVSSRRTIGPDGKPLPISDADRARVREWIASH